MGLTTITGNFPPLANNGRLVAIALDTITDGANVYPKGEVIATATIGAAGAFSIAVPDTQATGQRVQFRVERGTAAPYALVDTFDRVIPTATPTTLASLIDSFYAPTLLDASNWAIAQILAINPTFLASVPGFNELTWTSAQVFKLGDYTWRGDGLYRWISPTQGSNKDPLVVANVTPTVGAVWEKKSTLPIAAALNTNVRTYDQTIFETLTTEPASRKNLNELRSQISTPNLTNYAKLDTAQSWTGKQTFGAGASGVTATAGTNNADLATNAFVQTAIAAISASSALPAPVYWGRRSTDVTASMDTFTTIDWDDVIVGSDSAGAITLPSTGRYLAISQTFNRLGSNFSSSGGRLYSRVALFQNGVEIGDLIQINGNETNGTYDQKPIGVKPFTATANDLLTVRFLWGGAGLGGTPSGRIVGSVAQNYLMLFRMA